MVDDNENSERRLASKNLKSAFQDTLDEGVPEEFRELIDKNLKKAFEETVEEGVPDRFAALVAKLGEAAEKNQK